MIIDWTAAPEGTTHATIPNGDPRWYKLEGGKVFCWGIRIKEWMPSFFLTVDEIAETGLRLYANGEQSELVMLREQRDALLAVVKQALEDCETESSHGGKVCVATDDFRRVIALVVGDK
jgi:hypothetical protein